MNDNGHIEQIVLDRMVDGELSREQQHDLLLRLEHEPGGWRQLALAYVESQSWGREFDALIHSPETVTAEPVREKPRVPFNPVVRLLFMSAGLLIAFGLGFLLQGFRMAEDNIESDQAMEMVQSNPESDHTVFKPGDPETFQLLVADPATNSAEQVELPLVDFEDVGEDFFRSPPRTLPENIRRAFERTGHQVEEQRHFYPFLLQDGRQVIVPVDEVHVQYVGERPFQ